MARNGHLEETLRRILAEALTTRIDDPRVGFVTVSEVRLNRDRTQAQVFYTVLGDEVARATSLRGLKHAKGHLRQIIGDQTRLRQVPDLHFRYDESLDRSFYIESILDGIAKERPAPGETESEPGADPRPEDPSAADDEEPRE